VKHVILALCFAKAIAAANPIMPWFLNQVGSDTVRGQWVAICNSDPEHYDLHGDQITTSLSCCTLECSTGLVIDSAVLACGDSAHGTFRFNPVGDSVCFGDEWVTFPRLPAGPENAPAFPKNASITRWPWGELYGGSCWYVDSTPTPGEPGNDWSAISGSVVGLPPCWYRAFTAEASGPAAHCCGAASGTFYIGGLSPGKYWVTVDGVAYNRVGYHGAASESIEVGYAQTDSGVEIIMANWTGLSGLPAGDSGIGAKDGACLATLAGRVYALKGNRTCEFYCYDTSTNAWRALPPIPSTGRLGASKPVGRGATLCAALGRLYATKGSGTDEFWSFTPDTGQGVKSFWAQCADVPPGLNHPGAGASSTTVALGDTTWVYLLKGGGTNELCRCNPETDSWEMLAGPPLGSSGKPFRTGSAMASDGSSRLYVLKGESDELYVCNLLTGAWSSLPTLPLVGRGSHRHRAGSGAGLVYVPADPWLHPSAQLFALKGGRSLEFWHCLVDSPGWKQLDDVPKSQNRNVGPGGALTVCNGTLYALKGSRTLDFYSHTPDPSSIPPEQSVARPSTQGIDKPVNAQFAVFPSVFSRSVSIRYVLPPDRRLRIEAFDAAGRLVESVFDGRVQTPGCVTWRPRTLGEGIYFLRINGQTAKLIRLDERSSLTRVR
jgi:hypothetical protein